MNSGTGYSWAALDIPRPCHTPSPRYPILSNREEFGGRFRYPLPLPSVSDGAECNVLRNIGLVHAPQTGVIIDNTELLECAQDPG